VQGVNRSRGGVSLQQFTEVCMRLRWVIVSSLLLVSTLFGGVTVKLDPDVKTQPISRYIYGQFIEHLGRCIYGGLWAEMLEDRKFFFPITDEYKPWVTREDTNWQSGPFQVLGGSPWRVIGIPNSVKMEQDGAYAGEHSPVITIPGSGAETGISQEGLATIGGKKYTGHIVMWGNQEAAPVRVQLSYPDGKIVTQMIENLTLEFTSYPLEFTAPETSNEVKFEIISNAGPGQIGIGAVSLMPADNIKGFRPEVIELLKQLNSPIYRWPGGNFVSAYNWRDGIGKDRDKRPPRRNGAWGGIEHNDVGIHEFMDLMELINAEPFVALNMGLGSVQDAVAEVQYCVGEADTEMGKLRAENGHPQPWKVTYWAVGNEMFGSWQAGFMPQDQYVKKNNQAAAEIWKIDPKAQLVAVGSAGRWTENMLAGSADFMNLISEHIYSKSSPDYARHAIQLRTQVKRVADAHRRYRQSIPQVQNKPIPVAMDEWNFWYGPYVFGELGVRYRHKDALGVAMALHEFFRNTDIFAMANYAQTVNVLGAIKTTRTKAAMETTGLVLAMYRAHFGTQPIAVDPPTDDLDISAAYTDDHSAVTIGVVNLSREAQEITLDSAGKLKLSGNARTWTIASNDPEAYNDPEEGMKVNIVEGQSTVQHGTITVPPLAAVIYRFAQ
jgi:alpha-N-arabinofuranosidase